MLTATLDPGNLRSGRAAAQVCVGNEGSPVPPSPGPGHASGLGSSKAPCGCLEECAPGGKGEDRTPEGEGSPRRCTKLFVP